MNTLSHTTSRVLPNRLSNLYTPGRSSTILIGAHGSEPTVHGQLPSLTGLSPLRAVHNSVPNSAGLSWVRECLFAFPPTHSCDAGCSFVTMFTTSTHRRTSLGQSADRIRGMLRVHDRYLSSILSFPQSSSSVHLTLVIDNAVPSWMLCCALALRKCSWAVV